MNTLTFLISTMDNFQLNKRLKYQKWTPLPSSLKENPFMKSLVFIFFRFLCLCDARPLMQPFVTTHLSVSRPLLYCRGRHGDGRGDTCSPKGGGWLFPALGGPLPPTAGHTGPRGRMSESWRWVTRDVHVHRLWLGREGGGWGGAGQSDKGPDANPTKIVWMYEWIAIVLWKVFFLTFIIVKHKNVVKIGLL